MSYLTVPRVLLLSLVAIAAACSATGGSNPGTSSGGSAGAGGATAGGGSGGDAGTSSGLFDSGPADALPDPDAACALITMQATATPLDLYIAMDKSSSMAGTKWNGAKTGLAAFVNDPNSAGIRVALNFFPLDNNPTCDQFAYEPPVVPFDFLPQNATAINNGINAASPNGFNSPIYPALGGAILAGIQEAQNNPGNAAAVLLVTDGQPDGPATTCGSVNPDDPAAIAMLASAGVNYSPSVKTFVVGLPGVNQAIANQIAAAGGTGSAILVTITNVAAEFQAALAQVRGQALPCEFDIPTQVVGGQVDTGHVNVLVTPGGGQTAILPQDPTCSMGNGWYYDNPSKPQHIELCTGSCQTLRADDSAKVQILLGCQTEIK
jgi:hypothetical protein